MEDEYLFRPDEKGDLQLQILNWKSNNTMGGVKPGKPKRVDDVIEVTREGPSNGVIRITFEPKNDVAVGDKLELCARLTSPSGDLESIFWVRIVDPRKEEQKPERKFDNPTLPALIRVFEKPEKPDERSWRDYKFGGDDIVKIITSSNEPGQKDLIDGIAVNMDAHVVKRHISKNRIVNKEQIRQIRDRYCVSTYLHSLFLYGIFDKLMKLEKYEANFEIADFVRDVLGPYSAFLISVETNEAIMSSLADD